MAKVLLLACAVGAVLVLLTWIKRARRRDLPASPIRSVVPENMVTCWCGVHLPLSEAKPIGDSYCCSEEHLHGPVS